MLTALTFLFVNIIRIPALAVWRAMGWRPGKSLPELDKYIVIGVPHTSNWDYIHMLAFALYSRRRPFVTIKSTLFWFPLGLFLRAAGGIPIERTKSKNVVQQLADKMKAEDRIVIVVTPEGTRKYRPYWRTGFYYTALEANVPVVCVYPDYKQKTIGAGMILHPSGDIHADFEKLREFFATHGHGLYPDQVNDVALDPAKYPKPEPVAEPIHSM